MGKEQGFVKGGAIGGDAAGCGDTCERFKAIFAKGERDKAGPRVGDGDVELACDIIGQSCGPHFGNGFAPSRHDQVFAREGHGLAILEQGEIKAAVGFRDALNRCLEPQMRARGVHFCAQHRDDLFGRGIAEELPEGFLMVRNSMAIDQIEEIPLGVSSQRGFREMGIV